MSNAEALKAPVVSGRKAKDKPQLSSYKKKKIARNMLISFVRFILLFGLCFLIIQPVLNKISVSFMTEEDLYDPVVVNIPAHFTTENYKLSAEIMSYKEAFKNSMIIAITISILQVTVCTLVGYGFARYDFPFKKFWFAMVILVILIPPQTIASSLHLHFRYFDVLGLFKLITGDSISDISERDSMNPPFLASTAPITATIPTSMIIP